MKTMPDFSLFSNPGASSVNKEPSRTWFIPYSCRCNALSGARVLNGYTPESAYAGIISEKSTRRKMLNGDWSFTLCNSKNEAEQIFSSDIDTLNSQKIKIPSNLNASLISENSFCIYQREFTLPGAWTGRDVYINFDGIDAFFCVYINNEFAGADCSENHAAEFRITPLLKAGQNTVTVITQAKSGISRDVYLLARTQEHIRDIKVKTTLDTIYIDIDAAKENGAATVELYDNNNQLIVRKDSIIKDSQASFEIKIDNPINWTAESPYLYTALVHGFNEVIPIRVGLRIFTVNEKGEFLVNNQPVNLKGFNEHEMYIDAFQYKPLREIIHELLILKKHNINSVKTSFYPNTPAFIKLCDEMGFYIIDDIKNPVNSDIYTNNDLLILKNIFSPAVIKAQEMTFTKQTYTFTNTCDFTNLEDFTIMYTIKTPSQVFAQDVLDVKCAPHDTVSKSIDFTFPEFSFEEFFIEFSCKLKKDTVWAHAGYEVCFSQIKLPVLQTVPETETTSSMPPFSVHFSEENESGIMSIDGEDFTYRFNMATGTFTNIIFNGIEMLTTMPVFSVCKAQSDNQQLLLQQPCSCKILSKGSKYITLLASYSIASPSAEPFVTFSVLWAIYGSGEIGVGVTAEVKPDSPNFSRFGLEMKMPADNKFVSYYGYGPYSSLYNMKNHCKKGIYQSTVAQESALQICPHHSVNHFGVQWAVVHDAEGRGIMIKGMPEIGFSAEQDSTNDPCSLLRIDYNQSLDDKLFFYSFTIKPIFTECTDILRESRTLPGITEA